MAILTLLLFFGACAGIVLVWNRLFQPVPLRIAAALWACCALYQGATLFTSHVDVPGRLAFVAYPWMAADVEPDKANTGIIFTQIAPWTRLARDIVRDGEAPLLNRTSAGGSPLLANQQTAIFHPFTLLGLLLPLGKAFTLSVSLRLFIVAFFTFLLLRNWDIGIAAAIFGAVAYTFCLFHVVWLLFPLGLSTMMLPLCLVGVQEMARGVRGRSVAVLLAGLCLSVLGGHPESALWVWIVTCLFAAYTCWTMTVDRILRLQRLGAMASVFLAAMAVTAFFWWPTLGALRETPRFAAMQSPEANPADHGLTYEWLVPLLAPNALGTPVNGTYTPPRGAHGAVLNDYGEVTSGYAGLATLALALAAPFVARRRHLGFAIALMLASFMTFAEVPVWRDLIRAIPLAGISIHQRLRIFWVLGVCIAAAMTLDHLGRGERQNRTRVGATGSLALVVGGFLVLYAVRQPTFLADAVGLTQFVVPAMTVILIGVALWFKRAVFVVTILVLIDLTVAGYRYNPPASPEELYPITGAVNVLMHTDTPSRFVAMGWSFLPDTPGYYGIEDVKTTDPIQNAKYMRLLRGYLNIDPASYDLLVRDVSQPFFDYLNIRHVYAPPGHEIPGDRFTKIYDGPDGMVYRNERALPRYFFVRQFTVEPSFDHTVWFSRDIKDFASRALVDHIPSTVMAAAPVLATENVELAGGDVQVRRYAANGTTLDVTSNGWNLLVSSDVHWPGWRAYWNGDRLPPVVVNGAFVGCFVPPGEGELELRYVPEEFARGGRVSAASTTIIALIMILRFAHVRLRRKASRDG